MQYVAWYCAEMRRDVSTKAVVLTEACWSVHSMDLSALMLLSLNCKLPMIQWGNNTPIPSQPLLHELCIENKLDRVFVLRSPEDSTAITSKNNVKCWLVWPQLTIPLCQPFVQSISEGLVPGAVGRASGSCWHSIMVLAFLDRVLTYICTCRDVLCELTLIFWSVPEPTR